MSDKMNFQADVSKMLDIVVNSLYSEKQIFLRELISNASDACDKLKYMALTHPDMAKESGEMKIWITPDAEKNTLTIADNGIGMNKEDLINHLGTIAKSGTADFVKNASENGSAVGGQRIGNRFSQRKFVILNFPVILLSAQTFRS